jgi:hypothetical protein
MERGTRGIPPASGLEAQQVTAMEERITTTHGITIGLDVSDGFTEPCAIDDQGAWGESWRMPTTQAVIAKGLSRLPRSPSGARGGLPLPVDEPTSKRSWPTHGACGCLPIATGNTTASMPSGWPRRSGRWAGRSSDCVETATERSLRFGRSRGSVPSPPCPASRRPSRSGLRIAHLVHAGRPGQGRNSEEGGSAFTPVGVNNPDTGLPLGVGTPPCRRARASLATLEDRAAGSSRMWDETEDPTRGVGSAARPLRVPNLRADYQAPLSAQRRSPGSYTEATGTEAAARTTS